MAGTLTYGRNTLKKTYQSRSQPKSWYQQSFSDTEPAEWFDRVHAYRISAESGIVRNPFEIYFDYGQYDEDVVLFGGETSKAVSFNLIFDSAPIVVLSITSNTEDSNLNSFVSSLSSTGMVINTSAPFSGSIVYKAIYASSYPVYVRRTPLYSSGTYYASAGSIAPNDTEFVVNFANLGTSTVSTFLTPVDIDGAGGANVAFVATGSATASSMPVSMSSHLVGRVHYLAVVSQ
jgi:hypothetical protein